MQKEEAMEAKLLKIAVYRSDGKRWGTLRQGGGGSVPALLKPSSHTHPLLTAAAAPKS